jgi:hypothetical protein
VAVRATRVTVGTSPTALTGSTTDYHTGQSALIRNRGSVAVFIGDGSVTTSTGFQLDAGEAIPADLFEGETPYGIVASSTAVCHVLETGV